MIREKKIVAAFDFDGTITHFDSLFPFLFYLKGWLPFSLRFAQSSPGLLAYALRLRANDVAKQNLLQTFIGGMNLHELELAGKRFAERALPRLVKRDAMARIHWHLSQGHRCILISASLDIYLQPWAQSIGFSDVICSSLRCDEAGDVSGELEGDNCYGAIKRQRLEALLGEREAYTLYAYGDSRGDKELLDLADHAFYQQMPLPELY